MRTSILGMILILAGCASGGGYGNSGGLPSRIPQELHTLYIETMEPDNALHRVLRQELMSKGVRVQDMRTQTDAILRVSRERIERRASGASSSNRAYRLIYSATYVATFEGRELFFPETLDVYRDYTASSSSNTGGMRNAEEDAIVENLASDLARKMVRKLTTLR